MSKTKQAAAALSPDTINTLDAKDLEALRPIFDDLEGATKLWQRAANKWSKLDYQTKERIHDAMPPAWKRRFENLDRVADGSLHPLLAMESTRAERYLGQLPLAEQKRYLQELIPVAIGNDERMISVDDLDDAQRKQVFNRSGTTTTIRTPAQQRLFLKKEAQEAQERASTASKMTQIERAGWVIREGRCHVKTAKNSAGLTLADVERMLKDMRM